MAQTSSRTYRRKGVFNVRDEWKGFVFCLLLAMFLWMLTALNEMYDSNVQVNVEYQNKPRNLVFSNQLPSHLRINLTARGWDLFGYYLSGRGNKVKLNLEEYKRYNYLNTSWLKSTLQSQIQGRIVIHDIYPDTISLRRETQFTKKVPVKIRLKMSFEEQYGISGEIEYDPDSVTISGSKEIIPNIKFVYTELLSLNNISKTVNTSVDLAKSTTQNIHYSTSQVNLTVPMDRLTEKVVEVPITIVNPKFSGQVRLIPAKATISYQTTLSKYHQIDDNLFEAVVDGHQMDTITQSPLRIQLLSYPKFIYNPSMEQQHVDYIISK